MSRVRIALALSMVLNIFLVGAVVGSISWQKFGNRVTPAGALRIAAAELPADQRRAFRAAIWKTRASLSETVAARRDARARVVALLKQPDVDRKALYAALQDARTADFAIREAIESRAVAFALDLPAKDRAALASAIQKRMGRAVESAQ